MKKKLAVLLIAAMSVGIVSACGSDKETTEESQAVETEVGTEAETVVDGAETETTDTVTEANVLLKDYVVEDYVTLNEYKGMAITLTKYTVTDADVDSYISSILSGYGNKEGLAIMDRAVQEGDTVNINYSGKLDGVAFQGGTDDSEAGTNLGIGSHTFIAGFEEGLVGVKPGETVDLNLTFPEDYAPNPDLAGKETVFTVTVNGIAPTLEELTDEMVVLLNEETTTVEAYKQSVKTMLTEEAELQFENSYDALVEDEVIQKLLTECEFKELPEELVQKYLGNIITNTNSTASMYGMDLESYVAAAYGTDYTAFEAMARMWAEQSAQQALVFQAIANQENLNVDDATLEEELQTYAESYGYESPEELGEDIGENYREYLMFMNVVDFLRENAQVTVEE